MTEWEPALIDEFQGKIAALNERIAELERYTVVQDAAIKQQGEENDVLIEHLRLAVEALKNIDEHDDGWCGDHARATLAAIAKEWVR